MQPPVKKKPVIRWRDLPTLWINRGDAPSEVKQKRGDVAFNVRSIETVVSELTNRKSVIDEK